jgi:hypothetical protein
MAATAGLSMPRFYSDFSFDPPLNTKDCNISSVFRLYYIHFLNGCQHLNVHPDIYISLWIKGRELAEGAGFDFFFDSGI